MKRFLLFYADGYEHGGWGWNAFHSHFDTIEEAVSECRSVVKSKGGEYDTNVRMHVVDLEVTSEHTDEMIVFQIYRDDDRITEYGCSSTSLTQADREEQHDEDKG
jgi:hypothetical protein